MHIIPAINCQEFDEVKERFHVAQEVLFGAGSESHQTGERDEWVHIDIADGGFTNGYSTWRSPAEFKTLKRHPRLKVELHVMVNAPEEILAEWLTVGVDRVIFHIETTQAVEQVIAMCNEVGVEAMLALKPETPVSHVAPYLGAVSGCQVLAVVPGLSGQVMQDGTLEKIAALRKMRSDLVIEVDGGITPQTAPQCFAAGADQLTSSSYIFLDENPAAAYVRLMQR